MIDPDDIRQRLAVLARGYDLGEPRQVAHLRDVVAEALDSTPFRDLVAVAAAMGHRGHAARSRSQVVGQIVHRWGLLSPAERRAPASTQAERSEAAEHAASLAAAVLRAVGTDREAGAVERLRAHVEWLAGVTPGLGS